MSGHSKWSTIKRKKGAADAKRSNVFSKLIKEITVAARMGGGDPDGNPRLRLVIDKAKSQSMPRDNIERAIKKGTGELDGVTLEEVSYEGYGSAGVALIVECTTDNKNRTVAEIRNIFARKGGNLGESGSVSWMFEKKGTIRVDAGSTSEEDLFEKIIDAGADDMQKEDNQFVITTNYENFLGVSEALRKANIPVTEAEMEQVPKSAIKIDDEEKARKILGLVESLEECEDVQNVWANFDIDDSMLEKISG
ncbi:MAG: YebC/PmpR family DNA-binding transcriptional regulator [Deltaproteobacteria bacterium]|nr:YebC/PmpR family DNA-binding transcriptional regulator [Deltaproteobacteria bacterium]